MICETVAKPATRSIASPLKFALHRLDLKITICVSVILYQYHLPHVEWQTLSKHYS